MDRSRAADALLARAWSVPAGEAGYAAWSDPDGTWHLRPATEWSSGYPVGLRRLAGAPVTEALDHLELRSGPRSAFRAFRGYFGAVVGGDPVAVVAAARAFAGDLHDGTGIVPLDEVAAERLRPGLVETSIDAVGPAAALLARGAELTGDRSLADLAAHLVRWHLRTLVRSDGSVAQYALLDPAGRLVEVRTGPQGLRPDSTWARAQSWGLLAAALGARWLPALRTEMLDAAEAMADWWSAHLPADGLPRWDFDAPADDLLDTSAAAITAAALCRLAALEPGTSRARRHRTAAEHTVDAVTPHVTGNGLQDGCYHHRANLAPANELVWGDFHLLEALLALAGELDPLAC